ncbi:MAG: hypothetical protein JWP59_1233 [Massilia sp.]|nr:hypothetical protein [Massilia sp.]
MALTAMQPIATQPIATRLNDMQLIEPSLMTSMPARALCVSIHDVAPGTWSDCMVLLQAVREVAPLLPLTWLVVPRYHGRAPPAPSMEAALGQLLADGDELALHGYTHVDSGAACPGVRNHFVRRVYTTGEGEFAAIGEVEALQRIDLGLAWFAARGWPVEGFVPPAWLVSSGARAAVRQRPFSYTTSISHFHFLDSGHSLYSPSLMYSTRNVPGRLLSRTVAAAMAASLKANPLLRFALHPADARHPALLQHAQVLLEKLLAERTPMTKRQFVASFDGGSTGGLVRRGAADRGYAM